MHAAVTAVSSSTSCTKYLVLSKTAEKFLGRATTAPPPTRNTIKRRRRLRSSSPPSSDHEKEIQTTSSSSRHTRVYYPLLVDYVEGVYCASDHHDSKPWANLLEARCFTLNTSIGRCTAVCTSLVFIHFAVLYSIPFHQPSWTPNYHQPL